LQSGGCGHATDDAKTGARSFPRSIHIHTRIRLTAHSLV
jgi:hypothetical protein